MATALIPYKQKIYLARETMHKKLRARADKANVNKKHFMFNVNDVVLVKAQNVPDSFNNQIAKFFYVYEGPYKIKEKIGLDTYLISDIESDRIRGKFHINNLKPYFV